MFAGGDISWRSMPMTNVSFPEYSSATAPVICSTIKAVRLRSNYEKCMPEKCFEDWMYETLLLLHMRIYSS